MFHAKCTKKTDSVTLRERRETIDSIGFKSREEPTALSKG
jgi:hypothetical protein